MATLDADVIVIGSGPGGLTAAVLAAMAGKRAIVLEKHYAAGGYTHTFKRKNFKFDVGIHYIGDVGEGDGFRRLLDHMKLDGLDWLPINPDGYDRILGPGFSFDVPAGAERYERRLIETFPSEKKGVERYFQTMRAINREMSALMSIRGPADMLKLPSKAPTLMKRGWKTLGAFFDECARNEKARLVMAGLCGDYGLPPKKAPLPLHAMLVGHYFEGAYYPKGGSGSIPDAFVAALERNGGQIRLRTAAKRILVEKGRAVGVELENGETLRAGAVVSNAGAIVTYTRLIDPSLLPPYWRFRARGFKPSAASFCLFLGVKGKPSDYGLGSENWWCYPTFDLEKVYSARHQWPSGDLKPSFFASSPSAKDPSTPMAPEGHFTLDVVSLVDWKLFEKWERTQLMKRGKDYESLKESLADRLLDAVDERMPGIKKNVVLREASTPLTNASYGDYPQGAIYGLEKNFLQIPPLGPPVAGPLKGLYMAGADTLGHGFAGAVAGGYAAASALLKRNLFRSASNE